MPDVSTPSPLVGDVPPFRSCSCPTGPAARLLRLNVYRTPFLLATESSWSPAESVVRVGVVLQSESVTELTNGSCQVPLEARVEAFSSTIAWDWVWVNWERVPVDTKMLLVAAS